MEQNHTERGDFCWHARKLVGGSDEMTGETLSNRSQNPTPVAADKNLQPQAMTLGSHCIAHLFSENKRSLFWGPYYKDPTI